MLYPDKMQKNSKMPQFLQPSPKRIWPSTCLVTMSCLTLCLPGSSVHKIFQARILEWVAISSSRGVSWPGDQACVSCTSCFGRQTLYHWATWEGHLTKCAQTHTRVRPFATPWTVCSPPGSSAHAILRVVILVWVAIPYPGDLPDSGIEPRTPTLQTNFIPSKQDIYLCIYW